MGFFWHNFVIHEVEANGEDQSDGNNTVDYSADANDDNNDTPDNAQDQGNDTNNNDQGDDTTDYTEEDDGGGDQGGDDAPPADDGGNPDDEGGDQGGGDAPPDMGDGGDAGGDMGGGDQGGGDDGGTTDYTEDGGDDGGGDAGGDQGDGDTASADDTPVDELKKQEEELYSSLSPEQLDIKHKELKNQYLAMFDNITTITDRIGEASLDDDNIGPIQYVTEQLAKIQKMLSDYINSVYRTKSYIENLVNYNRFLAVLNGINKVLEEINKKDEKKD